jgi:hypothetical protein
MLFKLYVRPLAVILHLLRNHPTVRHRHQSAPRSAQLYRQIFLVSSQSTLELPLQPVYGVLQDITNTVSRPTARGTAVNKSKRKRRWDKGEITS